MLDAVLPLMTLQMAHYWATRENPKRGEMILSGGLAGYGIYECADGKYVALGALEPKFWRRFCELAKRPEWESLQYVQGEKKEKLRAELVALFKAKSRDEWVATAAEQDVCLTPVLEVAELETDPHLQARGIFVEPMHPIYGKIKGIGLPIKFSETPAEPSCPPPTLGEHTQEILMELGYSESEVAALQKKGMVLRQEIGRL
jgi:crotonobetainyl-CoA:carnitine CoA-transferase CaiB-like acyl-CoA transferase